MPRIIFLLTCVKFHFYFRQTNKANKIIKKKITKTRKVATGKQVSSKQLRNSCSLSCRLKCFEHFPDNWRENIFMDYYDKLNTEEQNLVLSKLMQVIPKECAASRRTKMMKILPYWPKAQKQSMLNHVSEHIFHFL